MRKVLLLKKKKNNRWIITDKMFVSLFITGTIIQLSHVGAAFIDGLIIGRFLGSAALAAQGIANPIYSIVGIISGLLAVGMQVRCAREIGRGNSAAVAEYFSVTSYVGAALAIVMTGLTLSFSGPLAVALGASGNTAELVGPVADYLEGFGIGIPATIMTAIFAPAFQLDSGGKTVQRGALIETVTNIMMDLVAVKLKLGLFGIGLATSVSRCLNLIYLCCRQFGRKERMLRFVKPGVSVADFLRMLGNGSEKAVTRVANTIRPIVLNGIIISYGGTAAMAALSVRNNFTNFIEVFESGVASAVLLLTGFYYGETNKEAIGEVVSYGHKLIYGVCGILSAAILIFSKQLASLYVQEGGDILKMTSFAFAMLALQHPLHALIDHRISYLQAIHRIRNMNALVFGSRFVFVLLSAFVCGRLYGVYGILACYTVGDALCLAAVYILYAIKTRSLFPEKSSYLNLPKEFDLQPGDCISHDVRNQNDVSLCSEEIQQFCRAHDIDEKTSYYAALAFEELASNIIEHGFPKNSSSHLTIDLRVVVTEEGFAMRISDNCPQNNVTKRFEAVNAKDADLTRDIGTRIVSRVASDISYLYAYETNNITIRFARNKLQTADPDHV